MKLPEKLKKFNESENFWVGLLRDAIFVVVAVTIFAVISQLTLGLWTPMVAVESGSMIPHINIGDIIFIQNKDRTEIITFEEGRTRNYRTFDDFGDVVLYQPFGKKESTPIIHRAMKYVEEGEPMWENGPPAPHGGYITKGDNQKTNPGYDQQGNISPYAPVKKEWIIGVARFQPVPWLGCISLIPRGNFACLRPQ